MAKGRGEDQSGKEDWERYDETRPQVATESIGAQQVEGLALLRVLQADKVRRGRNEAEQLIRVSPDEQRKVDLARLVASKDPDLAARYGF